MHPLVRIEKLHPDGSIRAAWFGYRLPDVGGWARVWTPPFTERAHVGGGWTPGEPMLSAFSSAESFVPHLYWDPDGLTFYLDVVREVRPTAHGYAYVDLYVDVILHGGMVRTKDEELLELLGREERQRASAVRDALVRRATSGDALFEPGTALWTPPAQDQELLPHPAPPL